MKKINLNILLVVILLFTACDSEEYLNLVQPTDSSQEDALSTEEGIKLAVMGAYSPLMRNGYHFYYLTLASEVSGGNLKRAEFAATSRLTDAYNWNYSPTNTFWGVWRWAYQIIHRTNNVLNAIEEVEMSTEAYNQAKGEALFLRAFAYFDLVRVFAQPYTLNDASIAEGADGQGGHLGVPILLTGQIGEPSRNTVKEVYDRILEDLLLAESIMGNDIVYTVVGSKYSVQALLSKVYLYMGNNAKAAEYASNVIAGPFSLLSAAEYVDSWGYDETSETIFSAGVVKSDPLYPTGGESIGDLVNSQDNGAAYGDLAVSDDYVNLLEAGDVRASLVYVDSNGENRTGKYPGKGGSTNNNNVAMFRLSEMYLIRAEANLVTDPTSSLADINALRTNRGLSNLGSISSDEIFNERRRELAFEGHILFDFIRTGRDLVRNDYPGGFLIKNPSTRFAFPIPEEEFNGNSNMVQNP